MGEDIAITYETLYEILRREKNREDIQELTPDFIDSVKKYLAEKRSMLYNDKDQKMLFSEEEQKKTLQQITNILKILRELYDKREKKIINLAINRSKTNSDIIDTSKLLKDEVGMYNMVLRVLNMHRAKILYNMIDENKAREVLTNAQQPAQDPMPKTQVQESQEKKAENPKQKQEKDKINIKFTESVDKFIDPDLKVHGPFQPGDTAEVPVKIAEVLIDKKKAQIE